MAVSVYFNNTKSIAHQRLFERLTIQMIKNYGIDVYYLPRTPGNMDPVFSEDATSSYDKAFFIEMYVKDSGRGFTGLGDFIDNGGPEINDEITLIISRKRFIEEIGDYLGPQPRPNEGDLVFLPLNNKAFRITFVEHESVFYQAGALYIWELKCSLFSYGGEIFDTGIPEIDGMTNGFDMNILGDGLVLSSDGETSLALVEDGLPLLLEEDSDEADFNKLLEKNDYYQRKGLEIIDFSEIDPLQNGPNY